MTVSNSRLLHPDTSLLLVVDMQEKFAPVIEHYDRLTEQCGILVQACRLLGVPVVVSEQYPKGLGHTVSPLKACLPADTVILEKVSFGCGRDAELERHIATLARKQVLVCGIEAHVCVNQTVHQLLAQAYQVHIIQDAIGARHQSNYKAAMAKMQQSGAIPATVEMALFELLGTAAHPQFKAIQALIK